MIRIKDLGDNIVGLILDRRDSPHNYQDAEAIINFQTILQDIAEDLAPKGVVISSAKKSFLVGGDLDELRKINEPEEALKITKIVNDSFRLMETMQIPFVATINGLALGGGLELALACNYRIGAIDKKLKLGLPEVSLGLMPGGGGTQRLPRLIGYEKAIPLLVKGIPVSGAEAFEISLLNEVAPEEKLIEVAKDSILKGRTSSQQPWDLSKCNADNRIHMPSERDRKKLTALTESENCSAEINQAEISIAKAINEGAGLSIERAISIENKYFSKIVPSPITKNKIRTLFYGLNQANSYKVRQKNIPKYKINEITTIGAGLMGAGICYKAASAGIKVNLIDLSEDFLETAIKRINKIANKAVERNLINTSDVDDILNLISPTTQYEKIGSSDLVIEAVSENVQTKQQVLSSAMKFVGKDIPIASNTSTISIDHLARKIERPDNLIGLHFFAPVERMKLVEVVKGTETNEKILARSLDFLATIRKTPIVVNDCPGFYTSRVVATYTAEALTMLSEGIPPDLIDISATKSGMPIGPLAMADMTSLVLLKDIFKSIIGDGHQAWVKGTNVLDTLNRLTNEFKRTGKKDGEGIYSYPKGSPEPWADIKKCFTPTTEPLDPKIIEQRIFFVQALEASRALEDGVIGSAIDGDLASVLGWAFPSGYGGVFGYIDYVGVKNFVSSSKKFAELYGDRFSPPDLLIEMANSGKRFHKL